MDSLVMLAEHLDKRPEEYEEEFASNRNSNRNSSNTPGRFYTLFAKVSYHQRFLVCLVALFAAVYGAITNSAAAAVGCETYVMTIVLLSAADICLWVCGSWSDTRGIRAGWSGLQWQCNTEELFKVAAGLTIGHMATITVGVLSAAGEISPPMNPFAYSSCGNYTLATGAYLATVLTPILYKLWLVVFATRCGVYVRGVVDSEEMQLPEATNNDWLYTRQRRARPRGTKRRRASSIGGGSEVAEEDCAICLGQIRDRQRITTLLGCGHTFHLACVQTWLDSQSRQLQSCPLCRTAVDQSADDQSVADQS